MEEIKDLGGLVNKDLAFSKLPQGAVYDSQNFRISTNDGNTSAARETIRGTEFIAGIPQNPCISSLTFTTPLIQLLVSGVAYTLSFNINGNLVANTLTVTYSTSSDLLTAVANFINTDTEFQNIPVTANSNNANNSVTLIIPDCSTITISSFTTGGGSSTSSFPYAVFDPECQYNTYPNVSSNYTVNDGYTGGPIWSRESASSGGTTTSSMVTGILNQAGTIVDPNATCVKFSASNVSTVSERFIGFHAATNNRDNLGNLTPLITLDTFLYFPTGPYNFEASFYIAKTLETSGTVTFLLDAASTIDMGFDPSLTFVTIGSKTYIELNQVTFSSGSTDVDYLSSTGNLHTFTWSAGANLFGTLGNATALGTYNFDLYVKFDANDIIASPSFSTTFYLDSLKVTGPVLNFASLVTFTNITPQSLSGDIIGWVALRDDIYLFTTDGIFNPNDPATAPFTSTGQIWKLSYNKAGDYADSNNYSFNLIYSNPALNFTKYRPIANPGMIEARYENNQIQKIYWTDNYNVPRQINVADPNVSTLTVEDLNLQPSLSMDLPFVTEVIDGGSLLVGVYQVAYRLKNINGAETRFSRTSKLVPIIDRDITGAAIQQYYPTKDIKDPADKSLRIQVSNLNTSYDTIEFVTIYYFDEFSEPEINIVKEAFIPDTGFVEIVITGAEEQIPITVDEFTAFNTFIKRAKTLAAKKQTLFLGNVTTADQEINFDSRAYRFPINDTDTYIGTVTSSTNKVTYDPITGEFYYENIPGDPVPENHDCIQDYDSQAPDSAQKYLYRPNSNILGGEGPNVKYEFFTDNVKLDNKFDNPSSGGAYGPHMTPDTNAIISFNDPDNPIANYVAKGSSLSNNASPYVYDLYVGYKRDEMYRFGIVFFDEVDNPTFVNWIADIRMPHIFMPNSSAGTPVDGTSGNRTRLNYGLNSGFSTDITYYDSTTNDLYGKPLGVKFTIDFSSVPNQYKKAMIVRTPLKATDKHILGQGLFRPTYKTDGLPSDGNNVFTNNPYRGNYAYDNGTNYNDAWYDCWVMDSPEFLFADFNNSGNDKIDVLGLLNRTDFSYLAVNYQGDNYGEANSQNWTPATDKKLTGFRTKNYQFNENPARPASIKNPSSNNPYSVILSRALPIGGNNLHYSTGISTLPTSNPTRTVYNCTPRDVTATATMAVDNGNNPGNSYNGKSVFVQLADAPATNWNSTSFGGNDFLTVDNWNSVTPNLFSFYTANYKRNVPSVFGGQSYFARSNSEYIGCNNLINISDKANPISTKVYGGDTVISVVDHVIQFPDRAQAIRYSNNNRVDVFLHMVYFPAETSIAVDYRRSLNNSVSVDHGAAVPNRTNNLTLAFDIAAGGWSTQIEVNEYFKVDPVFNYTDKTLYRYFPKPALIDPQETFDCRVWRSEPKKDGELVESWSVFKPGAYLDVESAYGPINNLIVFQDKLFFFQDRGFGVLQVAAQKLLTAADNDTSELVLGSSGILERYDYISTKTGTKHQFSMSVSDYSMLWFDTLARKIYRYKPGGLEPLSDIKGYGAYIYKHTGGDLQVFDNPYIGKGIHSTYDFRHNEFYMTFVNNNEESLFTDTLVYTDMFDGFVGSYTHYPKVYINDKLNIFSPFKPIGATFDNIYIHNYGDYGRFYGSQILTDAKLSFVVNSNPTIEKVFTNLEIVAESFGPNLTGDINYDSLAAIDYLDFFETIRVYNNYQNTDFIPTTGLSRRHKTIWNMKVPSDRVLSVTNNIFDFANLAQSRPAITRRMKDKWFVVDLNYSHQLSQGQNKFVVHTAKAIYSVNSR